MSIRLVSITAMLAAVMVSACSVGGSSTAGTSSGSQTSLIKQIQSRGTLRLGVDEGKPLMYKDTTSGQWKGYYIDLMTDWAKTLNVSVTDVPTTFGNMVAALQAGQIDVAVALNPRPARALSVAFTQPLTYEVDGFAILPAKTPGVTSWSQLNNSKYSVCVFTGSAPDLALTALKPSVQVTRLANESECQAALQSGRVNAVLNAVVDLASFAAANNGVRIIFPDTPINKSGTAFAIPLGYQYSDILAMNVEIQAFTDGGQLAASEKANGLANPLDYAIGTIPSYASSSL